MGVPDPSTMSPDQRRAYYLAARMRADALAVAAGPAALAAHLDPDGYQRRAHLDVIGETYLQVDAGEVNRVTVSLPPQTGKSYTAAVWGVFWWLVRHPRHRVVIASYADALALEHGGAVRDLVAKYGARFGLVLKRGSAGVQDWKITKGGGVRAVGVHTSLTGHRADFVVVDDVHKDRAEADSRPLRDKVGSWFSSTARSRLSPGAPVVMVATRWHEDDLIGRVVRKHPKRWRQVIMPAICTELTGDPIGRGPGEPLPHPRIPADDHAAALAHWASAKEDSDVRDWGSLYQCRPMPPEGALLPAEVLERRRFPEWANSVTVVKTAVAVDPSGGGRDVAGVIGGHLGDDGRLYLIEDRSGPMSSDDWSRAACELAADIDADVIVVEVNYGGDMATRVIRTAWQELAREEQEDPDHQGAFRFDRLPPRIVALRAKKGKRLRADPIAQQWKVDKIRTGVYMPELEEEWATWQDTSSDSPGRLDASVYLAYHLLRTPNRGTVSTTPTRVSRSRVGVNPRGTAVETRPAVGRARR